MFREMRRKDREIGTDEMFKILTKGEYGILGTIGEDGYPYTIPLSYVFDDNAIYFHCALEGHKLDNLQYQNKVSFCVVGTTKVLAEEFSTVYESVIAFGTASEINGVEKTRALTAIIDKYSPDFKEAGMQYIHRAADKTKVVKIEIERMTGKARKEI